ncbi:unnamed protein product [Sphagnum jensenii]|uniref:Choline transporter-like protein n=1 Tax=Sphagnum jensenii TaxID=128206 RepID=A0ABP1B3W9_9BRYO
MAVEGGSSEYEGNADADEMKEPLLQKTGASNGRDRRNKERERVINVAAAHPDDDDAASAGFGYNYGLRPYQDIAFSVIFVLLLLASIGFGIYGVVNSNPDYEWIESAHYEPDKGACSVPEHVQEQFGGGAWKQFWLHKNKKLLLNSIVAQKVSGSAETAVSLVIAITVVLSAPFALCMLWLLRKKTKELVYASLPVFILLPVALNVTWFVACQRDVECRRNFDFSAQLSLFLFVLLVCGLMIYVIYSNWDRIQLTIRVVQTAAEALYQNLTLLFVLPLLSFALIGLCTPLATFMVYAYTNGKLVPNQDILNHPQMPCGRGTDHPCCVWEPTGWVVPYLYLSGFAILWAAMITAQVQVFTISGTVAQWYFARGQFATGVAILRSLGHALGPSFGTMCLAGLVVAFVRLVRSLMNKANAEQGQPGALTIFLQACLESILQAVEFLTKFTTNFAAITGDSFCASAIMTWNLLKRNLLSTVLVEVISDKVLAVVMVALTLVYGIILYAILSLTASLDHSTKMIATISSSVMLLLVLSLFSRILSNIVDTVYICYAMDKDEGVVHKPPVHNVFVILPPSRDEPAALAVPHEN